MLKWRFFANSNWHVSRLLGPTDIFSSSTSPLFHFRFDPDTNITEIFNRSFVGVFPTDLRLDLDYIFYYNNLAKLIITGVVPFGALCIFNFKIYSALKKRRHVRHFLYKVGTSHRRSYILFDSFSFFISNSTIQYNFYNEEAFSCSTWVPHPLYQLNPVCLTTPGFY